MHLLVLLRIYPRGPKFCQGARLPGPPSGYVNACHVSAQYQSVDREPLTNRQTKALTCYVGMVKSLSPHARFNSRYGFMQKAHRVSTAGKVGRQR